MSDDGTILVYAVQLRGFNGPNVWRTLRDALDEVSGLLCEEDAGASVTIETRRMTVAEFEALPESPGY